MVKEDDNVFFMCFCHYCSGSIALLFGELTSPEKTNVQYRIITKTRVKTRIRSKYEKNMNGCNTI